MVGHVSAENVRVFTETPHAQMSLDAALVRIRETAANVPKSRALRDLGPNSIVFEAGCGAGLKILPLAVRSGCQVVGVDGSPAQIERVRAHAQALGVKGNFVEGWLENFESLTASFPRPDLIMCSAVIHHVHGWRDVLAQFGRVLKPGGHLYLTWGDPTLSLAGFNIKNQIAYRLGRDRESRTRIGRRLFGWWDKGRNSMNVEADSFFADLYAAYYIPITLGTMRRELTKHGLEIVEAYPSIRNPIVRWRYFFRFRHGSRVLVCRKR